MKESQNIRRRREKNTMPTSGYLFLDKDFKALEEAQKKVYADYKQAGKDSGEACTQSSETWHDNYPQEQAMRDMERNGARLEEMAKMLREAEIIPYPSSCETVQIGVGAKVLNSSTDEILFVEIGSFFVPWSSAQEDAGKSAEHPLRISYSSPMAQSLIGARQYDVRAFKNKARPSKAADSDALLTVLETWIPTTST